MRRLTLLLTIVGLAWAASAQDLDCVDYGDLPAPGGSCNV